MTGIPPPTGSDRGERLLAAMAEKGVPHQAQIQINTDFARRHEDTGAVAGQAASVLKGVADGFLGLGRAGMWLAENATVPGQIAKRAFGVDLADVIPADLRDALPEKAGMWVESRLSQAPYRTAGEIVGEVVPLVATGPLGAPGAAIKALGAPVTMVGAKILAKAPKLGKLAKIGTGITNTVAAGTGFGLYNYMSAEGGHEERAADAFHGFVAGAGLHVLGAAARATERTMLSYSTGIGAKRAAKALRADIFSNVAGTPKPGLIARLDAAIVGSAIEATGFAGLSKQWWEDVAAGIGGDEDAMGRALEVLGGSFVGVLVGRTGRPDIMSTFRREAPDLNTLEPRLLAESIRKEPEPQGPQGPQGPQEPLQLGFTPPKATGAEPAIEAAGRLPALDAASRPLFHSGWDLKPDVEVVDGRNTITMEFPGAGSIRMWENEGATGEAVRGFGLEVPPEVFRQVRGEVQIPEGSGNIHMEGEVANEFVRDLAAISMLRRIRGEILFGEHGEAWAGGPWRGRDDGRLNAIGLDGKPYSQTVFPEDGYRLEPEPPMPTTENGNINNPQIMRWVELAQQMRKYTKPNPGLDLLEASLALAVRGAPNSRSTQEVARLLGTPWQQGMLNADLAAQMLRPDTIEQFGLTVGQVAAGHLTAEQAMAQIGTSLAGPSKGTQLQAPAGEEPAQEQPRENGEAGFLDAGAILEGVGKIGSVVQETAGIGSDLYDFSIRSASRYLAERGGEPGKQLSGEMRDVSSRTRRLLGAGGKHAKKAILAADGNLRGKKGPEVTTPSGHKYDTYRYRQLIEGKVQPADTAETKFAESGNQALLTMQHTAVGAGMMVNTGDPNRGAMGYVPSQKAARATVPYQYSSHKKRGYYAMLDVPAARQSFYERLEDLHGGTIKAEALEKAYLARKSARDVDSPEAKAALEIKRSIEHMPATHEHGGVTWEILEPDPAKALHAIVERQSGRVAEMQVHGQDLPKEVREALAIRNPAANVKPGITERLRRFDQDIERSSGISDKEAVKKAASRLAERLQGREPVAIGRGLRAWNEFTSLPKAVLTVVSGVRDIPSIVAEPAVYIGFRRAMQAIAEFLKDPVYADMTAGEIGSRMHELGNIDMGLSHGPLSKIGEIISTPSNWLERVKTDIFDMGATLALRDWANGQPHQGDRHMLIDLLKFTPEQAIDLASGQASQVLQNRFRHELVQTMASRGRIAERSELAASPFWRGLIWFTGFATKRAEVIVTEVAASKRVWSKTDATAGERAAAAERLMKRWLLMIPTGLVGSYLAYLVNELLRGEDGHDRMVRELTNYPTKTVLTAAAGQLLAGPLGSLVSDEPEDLLRVAAPLSMLWNAQQAVLRGGGPGEMLLRIGEDTGVVPRQLSAIGGTLKAMALGDERYENVVRKVHQFNRLEGIRPMFSKPEKQPEFYSAMGEVKRLINSHKGDAESLWPLVEGEITKALDLQPEEKVAAKLRSMQTLAGKSPKQVDKLLAFLGEDDFELVVDHDNLVLDLASTAAKLDGKDPTPWLDALDMATRQAKAGRANAFGTMIDRVVEMGAERGDAGMPEELLELAGRMAALPEALERESSFSDDDRKKFKALPTPRLRTRLYNKLRDRANAKRDRDRAEARKEAR